MNKSLLYLTLSNYGARIPLNLHFNESKKFIDWTEEHFQYVRYNPRKNINRWGLSVTSLDGGLSGVPDLDSLLEFNQAQGHNQQVYEEHFKTPTPVFEHSEMKNICSMWQPYLFRTHILKLDPGGYFPPHRDHTSTDLSSFRLLVPLKNCKTPSFNFILEDKILNWDNGRVYFVDTAKVHYLFNAGSNASYLLVMNIEVNSHTVNTVIRQFDQR